MNPIAELVAILGFDVRGEAEAQRFQSRLEGVATTASNVARRMAVFAAGIATAASAAGYGLMRFVGPVAQEFDNLANTASRLGVAVEPLQEMRHAAEQAGIGAQNFDVALRRFIRRSAEAAQGTGAAKDAFEELGIQLRDNEGNLRETQDLFGDVADAIVNTESQADRLRLAFRFFDTDGAALVQMLENGSEGLEQFYREARELGLVMSEDNVDAAAAYTRELNILQRVFQSMRNEVAFGVMPVMTRWIRQARDWLGVNRELISMRLDQGLQIVATGIESVGRMALATGRSIRWLSEQIENLTGIGTGGQMAMLGAGAGLWLASRHPVLAGLAAAFLMLDDLRAYAEGENSVIGTLLAEMDRVGEQTAEWREKMDAAFAEEGKPALLEDDWISQIIQKLKDFDQALVDFIGPPPEILMPRIDMSSVWAGFEDWWDNLVQGFHDAGARAGAALVEGIQSAIRALLPESFLGMLDDANRSQAAQAAGRTVGGMVPPPSSGRGERVGPGEPDPSRFGPAFAPEIQGIDDLRSRLEGIHDGLSKVMDLSIRPHDVQIDRSVDFDQHNSITINQNVTGAASGAAAGSAVEGALDRSGRRAADIAAQEPSLQ